MVCRVDRRNDLQYDVWVNANVHEGFLLRNTLTITEYRIQNKIGKQKLSRDRIQDMPLSKITAASLEDTGYTVDPSAVSGYT